MSRHSQDISQLDPGELLADTLGHLPVGISIFDADLRLILCNDKIQQLLQWPEELLKPGTHLEAIVRFNAERGDYGAGDLERIVRERMDLAQRGEHHRIEREIDGRIIEIHGNPLPGGGFITIYSDVTELRLAERASRESEQRFRDFAAAASDWFWESDANHRLTYVSNRLYDVTGTPVEEVIGHTRWELAHEEDLAQHPNKWRLHRELLDRHEPFKHYEYSVVDQAGREIFFSISGVPVFDEANRFLGYRGVGTDVTALHQAREQLQRNERQLRTILEASPVGVAIVGTDTGRIRFANARFGQLTGWLATELASKSLTDLIPQQSRLSELFSDLEREGQILDREVELRHASGESFWALMTIRTMPFQEDEAAHFLWIYDISEQTRAKEALAQLANLDDLTGLANRRAFHDGLRRELALCRRGDRHVAVLYLDLDGFKGVNDNLGHDAGDQVLRDVARRLRHSLREGDLIGRVGGDEFATLLAGNVDPAIAEQVASKLIESVSGDYRIGEEIARLGVSVGIAYSGGGACDAETLISRADQAMYAAKRSGKGRLVVWSPGLEPPRE
ncbi:MAG: hypothetical protein Kow006_00600 [Gammaproteobacteria bacterium]